MEGKTISVCVLLVTLGIAVAVAGFAAESKRVKTYQLQPNNNIDLNPFCDYPSSPATGLAIAATMALVLARIIITTTTGGCCYHCRRTPKEHVCAQLCNITSWMAFFIAVFLFFTGVKLSTQKTAEEDNFKGYYCCILSPGVFSAASIVGLVSVLLGLIYYFLYILARRRAAEKSGVDLELEKPPITDVKKPTISDVLNL